MSLLNYFQRKPNAAENSLSKTIDEACDPGLTDREREEVIKQLKPNSEQKGRKRKKYCTWSPQQRAEIGQYAAANGNKAAIVKFSSQFPNIKRQTVSDFKKAYLECKKKNNGSEVTAIEKKKAGRPTLLPDDLMKKTIETVSALRLRGAPVSASVINAVAKGIVLANDRSLLCENGGYISLNADWARQILYRMDVIGRKMSRRMATTARIPVAPGILKETKLDFQRRIKILQERYQVPDDLILNFDQTPLPYVCVSNHTLHEKGASSVPLVGKGKKKQITGTFTVTKSGIFLPMQLIYEGKTDRCLPKDVTFPEGFDLTYTQNHWSNEEKALQHLTKIVFPYVEKKKAELNLPAEQKALLIFDVFKGQKTKRYQDHLESNGCAWVYIPANLTDQFQPLDVTVNAPAKEFLKKKFEEWYAKEISSQLERGRDIYEVEVPLKLSAMKPTHARWLLGLYDHMLNSGDIIRKGFKMAGIDDAIDLEIEPEDPFEDLNV